MKKQIFIFIFFIFVTLILGKSVQEHVLLSQESYDNIDTESNNNSELSFLQTSLYSLAKKVTMPLSGSLFMVIATLFVLVSTTLFIIEQYRFYSSIEYLEDSQPLLEEKNKSEMIDQSSLPFWEQDSSKHALESARHALEFTPTVSILILFCMFRSIIQSYDRKSSDYQTLQIGMILATVGIGIDVINAFAIKIFSTIVGTIVTILALFMTYVGYIILLWGLYSVRNPSIPLSLASKGIISLSTLLLLTMILIQIFSLKRWFSDTEMDKFIEEKLLKRIQQSISFIPLFLIILFYINFQFVELGSLPALIDIGIKGTTAGIFFQVAGVCIRSFYGHIGSIITFFSVLMTCIFFLLTMISIIGEQWTVATLLERSVFFLTFILVFLRVSSITIHEIEHFGESENRVGESEEAQKYRKVFADLSKATADAEIICVFFLFIDFHTKYILEKDVDSYTKSRDSIEGAMYLAVICICVQVVIILLEASWRPTALSSVFVAVSVLGVNTATIGLLFCVLL